MIPSSPVEILLATHNTGKIREVQKALRSLPVKLRYLNEFSQASLVDEVGRTYEENAVLKALGYAAQTGVCALADDSGLEIDALGGGPGVYSARFGGERLSDHDRIQKLLQEISDQPRERRSARFVCCMALAGWQPTFGAGEPKLLTCIEATCKGSIASQARGANGFGFDPVFVPEGYLSTFAELPVEIKATISHRARALAGIQAFLRSWLTQLDR